MVRFHTDINNVIKYSMIFFFAAIVLVLFSTDLMAVEGLTKQKIDTRIITVGGQDADLPGYTSKAIQIAVDALRENGGTVQLSSGIFEISAPVKLYDSINLVGSGESTVLLKIDGFTTRIATEAGSPFLPFL